MVDVLDTFGFVLDQPYRSLEDPAARTTSTPVSRVTVSTVYDIPTSCRDFEAFVDAEPAGAEVCHALFLLNPFRRRRRVHVHPLVP
jgi:hypothetical protein